MLSQCTVFSVIGKEVQKNSIVFEGKTEKLIDL